MSNSLSRLAQSSRIPCRCTSRLTAYARRMASLMSRSARVLGGRKTNPSEPNRAKWFDMITLSYDCRKANPRWLSCVFSVGYERREPGFSKMMVEAASPVNEEPAAVGGTGWTTKTNPSEPNRAKSNRIMMLAPIWQKQTQGIHPLCFQWLRSRK